MRKIFVAAMLALTMITGLSSASFAYDSLISIDSYNKYSSSTAYSQFFTAGTYDFSVAGGSWNKSSGAGGSWLWSAYIYQPGMATPAMLGNNTTYYASSTAAYDAHKNDAPVRLTVGSAGESIKFYVADTDTSRFNNNGSVLIGVTNIPASPPVAPEPVSSILFIAGGMVLVSRKYIKRKKA